MNRPCIQSAQTLQKQQQHSCVLPVHFIGTERLILRIATISFMRVAILQLRFAVNAYTRLVHCEMNQTRTYHSHRSSYLQHISHNMYTRAAYN